MKKLIVIWRNAVAERKVNTPDFPVWLVGGVFLQSLLAMMGSLYYSNYGDPIKNIFEYGEFFPWGEGLEPCQLCWWARILMYPIVALSLVALWRRDKNIFYYVLPLSVLGTILEIYHYMLQKFPIDTSFGCTAANPCSALKVDYFGFITIPFLCLVAFVVIDVLLISMIVREMKKRKK